MTPGNYFLDGPIMMPPGVRLGGVLRASMLYPSGDTTGETDRAAIQAVVDKWGAALRRLRCGQPGPLAVDGHAYQRRLRCRRKRRRR